MEIKCSLDNSFYNYSIAPKKKAEPSFRSARTVTLMRAEECAGMIMTKPVARKSATGFFSSESLLGDMIKGVKARYASYKQNIVHTYEHKVAFATVEKMLFGKNSIDSVTHDLDKLILYSLGFSKSFVKKWHREHSEHHIESGKKMNLRSTIIDNVVSGPELKSEKPLSLRAYYKENTDLQSIPGLKEGFEGVNYGEGLDYVAIRERVQKSKSLRSVIGFGLKVAASLVACFIKPFV